MQTRLNIYEAIKENTTWIPKDEYENPYIKHEGTFKSNLGALLYDDISYFNNNSQGAKKPKGYTNNVFNDLVWSVVGEYLYDTGFTPTVYRVDSTASDKNKMLIGDTNDLYDAYFTIPSAETYYYVAPHDVSITINYTPLNDFDETDFTLNYRLENDLLTDNLTNTKTVVKNKPWFSNKSDNALFNNKPKFIFLNLKPSSDDVILKKIELKAVTINGTILTTGKTDDPNYNLSDEIIDKPLEGREYYNLELYGGDPQFTMDVYYTKKSEVFTIICNLQTIDGFGINYMAGEGRFDKVYSFTKGAYIEGSSITNNGSTTLQIQLNKDNFFAEGIFKNWGCIAIHYHDNIGIMFDISSTYGVNDKTYVAESDYTYLIYNWNNLNAHGTWQNSTITYNLSYTSRNGLVKKEKKFISTIAPFDDFTYCPLTKRSRYTKNTSDATYLKLYASSDATEHFQSLTLPLADSDDNWLDPSTMSTKVTNGSAENLTGIYPYLYRITSGSDSTDNPGGNFTPGTNIGGGSGLDIGSGFN